METIDLNRFDNRNSKIEIKTVWHGISLEAIDFLVTKTFEIESLLGITDLIGSIPKGNIPRQSTTVSIASRAIPSSEIKL